MALVAEMFDSPDRRRHVSAAAHDGQVFGSRANDLGSARRAGKDVRRQEIDRGLAKPCGARNAKAMFSNTVRCGYSEYCWNTKATSRSAGASRVTSRPSIRIEPLSGISKPATRRNVVVLPAPVGPSSATNSPSATFSDSSLIAGVSLNALETALISTSAMRASLMQCSANRPTGSFVEDRQCVGPEGEPDALSCPEAQPGGQPGLEGAVARRHGYDLRRAELFRFGDLA